MLVHRHRMQPADIEDVISESVLEVLSAPAGYLCSDGLLVLIASRRAVDFLRRQRRELSHSGGRPWTVAPERSHLERELFARAFRKYASEKKSHDTTRLLSVANKVLDGSSFSLACRESGIPRGSQSRYRKTLGDFLDRVLRRH